MHQDHRVPRASLKIMEFLPVDFRCVLRDLHPVSGTTSFPLRALKLNVIASAASGMRDLSKRVPHFYQYNDLLFLLNLPENIKIQKFT